MSDHPLLGALGRRIRALRGDRGLTLGELAARSGVSPRFLQELEAGRGNISVARLAAVADALEQPVAHLLAGPAEDDAAASDGKERTLLALELAALNADELKHVLAFVRSRRRGARSGGRIALIGLRGAGKTTVGQSVAKTLRIPFVELDQEIERAAGMPLADVFSIHGERYYRRLELDAVKEIVRRKGPLVVSAGGGIVMEPDTWDLLSASCHTIWLEATPDDHWNRVVAQGDQRPMQDNPQAMAELRALLRARTPLYARARERVNTSGLGLEGTIEAVLEIVRGG